MSLAPETDDLQVLPAGGLGRPHLRTGGGALALPGDGASSRPTGICLYPKFHPVPRMKEAEGEEQGDGSHAVPWRAMLTLAEAERFSARGCGQGRITPSGQEQGHRATRGHFPRLPNVPATYTQLMGGLASFCSQGSVYEPLGGALTLRGTREAKERVLPPRPGWRNMAQAYTPGPRQKGELCVAKWSERRGPGMSSDSGETSALCCLEGDPGLAWAPPAADHTRPRL